MAATGDDALHWALALLQAPGERHVLRRRPLPGGIERLLLIAGGEAPEVLAQAAAETQEPPARLIEAARFYAREVLFHPQADAYRLLGATADADAAVLKRHHRLLQHWLHPDRVREAEDAVFAARINQAWNRLRTPALRAAYDAGQAHARDRNAMVEEAGLPMPPGSAVRDWASADALARPAPRRQRWPVYALLALGLLLGLLVLRETAREPARLGIEDADLRQPAAAEDSETLLRQALSMHSPYAVRQESPSRRAGPATVAASAAPTAPTAGRQPVPAEAVTPAPARAKVVRSAPAADLVARQTLAPPASRPPAAAAAVAVAAPSASAAPAAAASTESAHAPAAVAAREDELPSMARVVAARSSGERLLAYLDRAGQPSPPIWNNPRVEAAAAQLGVVLRQSGARRVGEADWRIGSLQASLRQRYRIPEVGERRIHADLVWREGQWLVRGIELEPPEAEA
ncbi:J domain-containing protein [Thermomonas flagellata]|uniref:J domain-containing protein n=1 Tax=Thermomonas flagellata TaxID=2888524 RepID=UPI001F0404AC|nr:J domain-containing protein [Thermomonas flagellata]